MNKFVPSIKNSWLVVSLLGCLLITHAANTQKKKNLLFIMTDHQQYKALSIAGNSVLETPNLDRLAKGGFYFKNAYTPMTACWNLKWDLVPIKNKV